MDIYNKYIIKVLILDLFSRVKKMFACTSLNMKLRQATGSKSVESEGSVVMVELVTIVDAVSL